MLNYVKFCLNPKFTFKIVEEFIDQCVQKNCELTLWNTIQHLIDICMTITYEYNLAGFSSKLVRLGIIVLCIKHH